MHKCIMVKIGGSKNIGESINFEEIGGKFLNFVEIGGYAIWIIDLGVWAPLIASNNREVLPCMLGVFDFVLLLVVASIHLWES